MPRRLPAWAIVAGSLALIVVAFPVAGACMALAGLALLRRGGRLRPLALGLVAAGILLEAFFVLFVATGHGVGRPGF